MLEIAIKLVRTINSAGWAMCIFYNHSNAHRKPMWESVYKLWWAPVISIFLRMRDGGVGVHQTGEGMDVMQGIHGTPPALRYPNLTQFLWLIWNITNPWNIQKLNFLDVTGTVKTRHGTVQTRSFCHSRVQVCHFSRVRMWPLPEATGAHDVESSQELLLFSLSLSFVRVSW